MTTQIPPSVSKWLEKKKEEKVALAEKKETQSAGEKQVTEIPEHLQFTI